MDTIDMETLFSAAAMRILPEHSIALALAEKDVWILSSKGVMRSIDGSTGEPLAQFSQEQFPASPLKPFDVNSFGLQFVDSGCLVVSWSDRFVGIFALSKDKKRIVKRIVEMPSDTPWLGWGCSSPARALGMDASGDVHTITLESNEIPWVSCRMKGLPKDISRALFSPPTASTPSCDLPNLAFVSKDGTLLRKSANPSNAAWAAVSAISNKRCAPCHENQTAWNKPLQRESWMGEANKARLSPQLANNLMPPPDVFVLSPAEKQTLLGFIGNTSAALPTVTAAPTGMQTPWSQISGIISSRCTRCHLNYKNEAAYRADSGRAGARVNNLEMPKVGSPEAAAITKDERELIYNFR